jgi:hypothetical protein
MIDAKRLILLNMTKRTGGHVSGVLHVRSHVGCKKEDRIAKAY